MLNSTKGLRRTENCQCKQTKGFWRGENYECKHNKRTVAVKLCIEFPHTFNQIERK